MPPNNQPDPDKKAAQARLKEIPIKDLSKGEQYTQDELEKLRVYWTEERTAAVAVWIDKGTPKDARPDCMAWREEKIFRDKTVSAYDLRGFNLQRYLETPRTEESPRPDLSCAHLEHAVLWVAHLEHAHLSLAHLEYAVLRGAHFEHAVLSGAHLGHAILQRAHLDHADLTETSAWGTAFINVYLDGTIFQNVRWTDGKGKKPDPVLFHGFDVRGIRYSDPLFDQWVRQSNFIARVKQTLPKLHWLWNLTCKCGRSFGRWIVMCTVFALLFGFAYYAFATWGSPVVKLDRLAEVPREPGFYTYLYFSIVTFTTLGFGDVTPTGLAGELLVTLEVILGYVGLGGLISIFTTKLVPPR